ncbi:MAG: tetratricopeptide repeat protein [Anaerolineae bacterium]|nr:tetratricopeptide repeat protein [Anaerolineae bacterium]
MAELSFYFTSNERDETSPIEVALFHADTGEWSAAYPFELPFGPSVLNELRWYLEEYTRWPSTADRERAGRIESRLQDLGRALLKSALPDPQLVQFWQSFVQSGADRLVTIDALDPRVQRMPWELVADGRGHLFAQGISVRRRLNKLVGIPAGQLELPLRVLLVVSRPEGIGAIDPRNVSHSLLEALAETDNRVVLEFLYPPTFKALSARLRNQQEPPVHAVHFDGQATYDVSLALGHLVFESDIHQADWIDANRLGSMLDREGTPLMVVNACQSASQEKSMPYASVAVQLVRAGVDSVLVLDHLLLPPATEKLFATFYGCLAHGYTVGKAMDEARHALQSDAVRQTLTHTDGQGKLVEEAIRLHDWFLPTLYQQSFDPVVCAPDISALPLALTDPVMPGGLPARPLYGVQGRAGELLQLERALAEYRIVVLHGPDGVGKTTLAAEAGRWFYRTGRFPGGAVYVSFEHGGSLAQLCNWVGQAIRQEPNFTLGEGSAVEQVAGLLREYPTLVILDCFDAVLSPHSSLPPEEVRALLDAVWTWGVGARSMASPADQSQRSRVLIVVQDTAFGDRRFVPSRVCAHVELAGLTPLAALELAAAVFDVLAIDRMAVSQSELDELMDCVGRHPLPLCMLLSTLRHHPPAELLASLEGAGAAPAQDEALDVAWAAWSFLNGEHRAVIADLAVFRGGAVESRILEIVQADPGAWQAARTELEHAALLAAETLPRVNSPFLRFHPALHPYLAAQVADDRRAALEERYWQVYAQLAPLLHRADTQTSREAQALAVRELPNLRRAFELIVAAGDEETATELALAIAHFLERLGRWWEREEMMEKLCGLRMEGVEGLTRAEYLMMNMRGEALLQQGRSTEAEQLFRGLLKRLESSPVHDSDYEHAYTVWNLGRCLTDLQQAMQALCFHQRALDEFESLSKVSESAKKMVAACHTDWAVNLVALGQFEDAKEHYETARAIFREQGDLRSVGVVLSRLGGLAAARGSRVDAEQYYTKALDTFRALDEPREVAAQWHQLARVAEEAGDLDEAERCYQEAVRIRERVRDRQGLAETLVELARLARNSDRPDEAERNYLRAAGEFEYLEDQLAQAQVLSDLAALYLSQERLDEALQHAHQAMTIDQSLDDPAVRIWRDYDLLAKIAEARGELDQAVRWRHKVQESFVV